jgi:hypothetical protein
VSDIQPDTDQVPAPDPANEASAGLPTDAEARPLRGLAELTQALLDATTADGVLQRITIAARYLVPGADLVSITLRQSNGEYYTPTNTETEAIELDHVQYETGEGPCLDAADPEGPAFAHSGDLSTESAWPEFARQAADHGYSSVLSTALITTGDPTPFTGALNIYSREPRGLNAAARDTAFILATYASLALGATYGKADVERSVSRLRAEAANLRKALETRTVIGQATGILMARRRISADEAFEVLVRVSQDHNIKLARLAEIFARHPETVDRI